jgi:FkbM family methyltransferase
MYNPPLTEAVPRMTPDERRAKLIAHHEIDLLIDVGANVGQFAHRLRAEGYRGRIESFEPTSYSFSDLERNAQGDPDWNVHRMALGESPGKATINILEDASASSILPVTSGSASVIPDSARIDTETVGVRRLDDVWREIAGSARSVYLKADVQGFEDRVLRGASGILPSIALIETEVSMVPLYDGAPLYNDVIDLCRSLGFRLVGLETGFEDPITGELFQFDAIFAPAAHATGLN